MWKTIFTTLLIFLLLSSCMEDGIQMPGTPEEIIPVDTIISNGQENYQQLDSDYLFDDEKLHRLDLNLPQSSLDKIDADPAAEEYVEGSISFEGETISPIGIRYKGSIGAFSECLSGNNWFSPSGRKTCTKLSMKIKINWNGSDLKFYGLKKVQLHSMNQDDSQLRDRVGYWIFGEMGLPAPRVVHTKLFINGQYNGLYAMVENVDGRFVKQHFKNDDGNLYKEVWPLLDTGEPAKKIDFQNALKTNEEEADVSRIQEFAKAIHDANEEELKGLIETWMDIDEIMSYVAVDRTIRHDDGPFHWYCSFGGCTNHNYYWYEDPIKHKFTLVPWDMDHAFANIIFDANTVTAILDDWGETRNNCQSFTQGFFGLSQKSAACDKLTFAWTLFENELLAKIAHLKEDKLSDEIVMAKIDLWAAQISAASQEAAELHDDAISLETFLSAVSELKGQIAHARKP